MKVIAAEKTVVVTGGSVGVGRAVALEFARNGWRVALLARGIKRLEATAKEIRALGAEALIFSVDVADATAVEDAAARVVRSWGHIDVWVNNAMVTVFGRAETIEPAEFQRVTDVTYLGQVHGTLAALRWMRERNQGTIVCIGSALTYRSIPLQSAYCGAKAAVRGFVDSLRCELLHDKSPIKLTMVHLPAVNTPQFDWARCKMDRQPRPVAPVYQPQAIAIQVYKAALSAPRELWVGQPTVKTILGGMALPSLTDRFASSQAYEGQLDESIVAQGRRDNLFEPADIDTGVGRFGSEARGSVHALSSTSARAAVVGAGLTALGLGFVFSRRLRGR